MLEIEKQFALEQAKIDKKDSLAVERDEEDILAAKKFIQDRLGTDKREYVVYGNTQASEKDEQDQLVAEKDEREKITQNRIDLSKQKPTEAWKVDDEMTTSFARMVKSARAKLGPGLEQVLLSTKLTNFAPALLSTKILTIDAVLGSKLNKLQALMPKLVVRKLLRAAATAKENLQRVSENKAFG